MIRPTIYYICLTSSEGQPYTLFYFVFLCYIIQMTNIHTNTVSVNILHCQSILSEIFHSNYNDFHCVNSSFTIEICELPSILWTEECKASPIGIYSSSAVTAYYWTTAGLWQVLRVSLQQFSSTTAVLSDVFPAKQKV